MKHILYNTVDYQTNSIAGVVKELYVFGKDIFSIEELTTKV